MEWNIAAEAISLVMIGIIGVYARKGSHLPTLKTDFSVVPDGYLQRHFYQYPVNDYDSAVPGGAHLAHLDSNHGVFCADAADGNGLFFIYGFCYLYGEPSGKKDNGRGDDSRCVLRRYCPVQSL